jgi:hypothetical protein
MISADWRDYLPTDRRVTILIIAALVLVLMMAVVVITWGSVLASADDFEDDCRKLGGTTKELGDDTLCMIGDHVVGTR